jgi:hypothetical protein
MQQLFDGLRDDNENLVIEVKKSGEENSHLLSLLQQSKDSI